MNLKTLLRLAGCTVVLSLCAHQASATSSEPEKTTSEPDPESDPKPDRAELQRTFALSALIQLRLAPTIQRINDREIPLKHQQIIYEVLKRTSEVRTHKMRGQEDNNIYYNKETGQEIVFDKDGNRVNNGYNDGSYNYAFYQDEPLLHFIMDTSPWIQLGQSESDPTTVNERIYAYMGDLESGMVKAQRAAPFEPLPDAHLWTELGQLQTLGIFIKAIEAGEAQEFFELFDQDDEISDEQIIRVLTKLNKGFDIVYATQDQETP
jgi:hypothetical protein